LYQAVSKREENIKTARSGSLVDETLIWPVVYTCYMLDIPFDCTVNFEYSPQRTQIVDDVRNETFQMGSAYNRLSFALAGLPEPKVNRNP
jgi:hypothetical protein